MSNEIKLAKELTSGAKAHGDTSYHTILTKAGVVALTNKALPLAGGTMSGDIVLGTNLIQGLQIHTPASNNTGLGIDALSSIEGGSLNVAVGDNALLKTNDGSRNVGIGVSALMNNTEGDYNIAIGFSSLGSNITTSNNTAVGYNSLENNIADNISAFGFGALSSNTTGGFNNAFGSGALTRNITGDSNNAFGSDTLVNNLTGRFNSAFGNHALKDNTSHENSAFGSGALTLSTTGRYNTAVGTNSLSSNTTSGSSTGVGRNSLLQSTGANNTAIGDNALSGVTTGFNNVGIGASTGGSIGTGSNCIVIGYGADVATAEDDNQLNIGNWIYGLAGDIGIGQPSPAYNLDVTGTGRFTDSLTCQTLIQTSQADQKRDVLGITKTKSKVIEFKEYSFISDGTSRKRYGVLAEDIEDDYPELVYTGPNGLKGVNYIDLLVKRVAELEKELADMPSGGGEESHLSNVTSITFDKKGTLLITIAGVTKKFSPV